MSTTITKETRRPITLLICALYLRTLGRRAVAFDQLATFFS